MKKGIFSWKTNFFSGLLAILPIVISVALAWWVFNLLTVHLTGFLKQIPFFKETVYSNGMENPAFTFLLQFLSLFIALFAIYFVGLIGRNYFGKRFFHFWEGFIKQIPIVRVIYSTVRQIMNTILSDKSHMFSKVVLVEYPRKGVYVVGFITADGSDEINKVIGKEKVTTVFVPTTPNPTSGFLIFVPECEMTILNMSVTEGMQLVISGGSVIPEELVQD